MLRACGVRAPHALQEYALPLMSFRRRLTLTVLLIVVVPVIALNGRNAAMAALEDAGAVTEVGSAGRRD